LLANQRVNENVKKLSDLKKLIVIVTKSTKYAPNYDAPSFRLAIVG
jgi:hypothetical protein